MFKKSCLTILVCAAAFHFAPAAQAAGTTKLGIYEEYKTVNCAKALDCYLFFSKVTADTKITSVSCNFWINANNPSLTGLSLGASNATRPTYSPAQYINPPYPMMYGSTVSQYQFYADTQHVVANGTYPTLQLGFNVSATSVMNCSIAGTTSALLPGAPVK